MSPFAKGCSEAQEAGRRGGKIGGQASGFKKVRGNSAYYSRIGSLPKKRRKDRQERNKA